MVSPKQLQSMLDEARPHVDELLKRHDAPANGIISIYVLSTGQGHQLMTNCNDPVALAEILLYCVDQVVNEALATPGKEEMH